MAATIDSIISSAVSELDSAYGLNSEQDFQSFIEGLIAGMLPVAESPDEVIQLAGTNSAECFTDPEAVVADAVEKMDELMRSALLAELYLLQNP